MRGENAILQGPIVLQALIEPAQNYPPSTEQFGRFCGCLGDLAVQGRIPFTKDEVVSHRDECATAGYPPVHHSDAYRTACRPDHRVVARD